MQNIIQTLPLPEQEEEGKTLAVRWMERGAARGKARGERKAVRRLLVHRFGPLSTEVDARLEAADVDTLERWAERLLHAPTLGDVFG